MTYNVFGGTLNLAQPTSCCPTSEVDQNQLHRGFTKARSHIF